MSVYVLINTTAFQMVLGIHHAFHPIDIGSSLVGEGLWLLIFRIVKVATEFWNLADSPSCLSYVIMLWCLGMEVTFPS